MTDKPRNRIVVFRLSQEEYRALKEACDRCGARNLSDFTRSGILTYLRGDSSSLMDRRFAMLEQEVASLKSRITNLLQGSIYVERSQMP